MDYQLLALGPVLVLERLAPLSSVNEAADLVAACMEHDTDRLLLDGSVLPADFFRLHTLFAGEFLQKLQNYQIRTGVVVPEEHDYGERFAEYLIEARRARFSRFLASREEALVWLAGG